METQKNPFDSLMPTEMAKKAEEVGIYKATKNPFQSLVLAISAGVFISIAFVFYTTVTIGTADMAYGISHLVGGLAFSLGLILVVICGGDLFTSSVLTTIARASGRISSSQLLKNWATVYVGNLIGAAFFVLLVWFAKLHLVANGAWGVNAMNIAQHKLHHDFTQAVALGLLCNLLVCLATWMTFSCRSATDKVVVMLLPVAMFVATGFEHSIANMFMVPMGIMVHTFADAAFWQNVGLEPALYADLTLKQFVLHNLIPVTIGNILGGLLVGMTYWIIHLKPKV
ncbi:MULTISPECIES: formate transporter FocA [unclassified Motilimonas]|uniref:formate transporter FocA n=2 Tax=Motilimonas TaxID=1914248 RepID=UPI001E42D877|nr:MULTISPECIES: formate transporter FocA [unclassified Motilimonas]MCE0557655.1 formate transporter FocA [Motilimonas sp. E26]MDO6526333.1 formate transporter FocA [Motilimonas sp. 1_MG-2023]